MDEIEKAAEDYASKRFPGGMYSSNDRGYFWGKCNEHFTDGALYWKERSDREITELKAEIERLK